MNQISNLMQGLKKALLGNPKNPFIAIARYRGRNAGILFSLTLPEDPSQVVTPIGFYSCMNIQPGSEAGPDPNDQRGLRSIANRVFFGHDGIYDHLRPYGFSDLGLRVDKEGNTTILPNLIGLLRGGGL